MTDCPPTMKGSTRTDLRPNRPPADTPRGRLHRTAVAGANAARRAGQLIALTPDIGRLWSLAQRGVRLLTGDESRGARLISHVCQGLDQALDALVPLVELDLPWMCDEIIGVLAQLELAENQVSRLRGEVAGLKQGLAFERSQSTQLQASLAAERDQNVQLQATLAAEKVRTTAALRDIPSDRFDEPTRSLVFLAEETRVIDDPNAPLGGPTYVGSGVGPPRRPRKRTLT